MKNNGLPSTFDLTMIKIGTLDPSNIMITKYGRRWTAESLVCNAEQERGGGLQNLLDVKGNKNSGVGTLRSTETSSKASRKS